MIKKTWERGKKKKKQQTKAWKKENQDLSSATDIAWAKKPEEWKR